MVRWVTQEKKKDFIRPIDDLQERLSKLEYDYEYIESDEFIFIKQQCIEGILKNYSFEKLEAFNNIFINSIIKNDIPQTQKEIYISILNSLEIFHMKILKFLYNPKEYLKTVGIPEDKIQGNLQGIFNGAFPGNDEELIENCVDYLCQKKLVNISGLGGMTSSQGFRLLGGPKDRLTEFGKKFIDFIFEIN